MNSASFALRNAEWDGSTEREFHQFNTRHATRIWRVRVEGARVITTWGIQDGAEQTATTVADGVNIGKANEISPEGYALYLAKEMCRKKNWEGYREVWRQIGESLIVLDPEVNTEIDFDNLPQSLSFYKPDNTMGAAITKKALAERVWYSRKRNGMMKILVNNSKGELKMFSRRMLLQHDDEQHTQYTWADRFPHIMKAVQGHLPQNSILLGELVVEVGEKERFDLAQSYIKSLTPKAIEDMEVSGIFPFFYCWDVAFWNGQDLVGKVPFRERYSLIQDLTRDIWDHRAFRPNDVLVFHTPDSAITHAKELGWEGFVVIDPETPYGEKAYNFKGKPDRPAAVCAKLKPTFEDDFIAIWNPEAGHGERSTKERYGLGIKSVSLWQYNSRGELVFISNVSSGLTKEMKTALADPTKFPQVWKVEYKDRRYVSQGDDTNALDFAAYVETRTDKKVEECINPEL